MHHLTPSWILNLHNLNSLIQFFKYHQTRQWEKKEDDDDDTKQIFFLLIVSPLDSKKKTERRKKEKKTLAKCIYQAKQLKHTFPIQWNLHRRNFILWNWISHAPWRTRGLGLPGFHTDRWALWTPWCLRTFNRLSLSLPDPQFVEDPPRSWW